jgi:hypothetical protein
MINLLLRDILLNLSLAQNKLIIFAKLPVIYAKSWLVKVWVAVAGSTFFASFEYEVLTKSERNPTNVVDPGYLFRIRIFSITDKKKIIIFTLFAAINLSKMKCVWTGKKDFVNWQRIYEFFTQKLFLSAHKYGLDPVLQIRIRGLFNPKIRDG